MNNFEDIKIPFKDEKYIIPANKIMKLLRKIGHLVKLDYLQDVEGIIKDQPWLFTDPYALCLEFAGLDEELDDIKDDVLMWAHESELNMISIVDSLMAIKMSLYEAPKNIQAKVSKKKKVATKKK